MSGDARRGQRLARLVCVIQLIWLPLQGSATQIRGSGYIKQFATAVDPPGVAGAVDKDRPAEGASLSRARLRIVIERGPLSAELAYELAPRIEPAASGAGAATGDAGEL